MNINIKSILLTLSLLQASSCFDENNGEANLVGVCSINLKNSSLTYTFPDGGVEYGRLGDFCEYKPKSHDYHNNLIGVASSDSSTMKLGIIYIFFDDVSNNPGEVSVEKWPTGKTAYSAAQNGEIPGKNQIAMQIYKLPTNSVDDVYGSLDTGATADFSVLQWPPDGSTGAMSVRFSEAVLFEDGSKLELEFSAELETHWEEGWGEW